MALSDFFRINLPYGIQRNDDGSWYAFNREYVPLGFGEDVFAFHLNKYKYPQLPIDVYYVGFERDLIDKLGKLKGTAVHHHTNGNIDKIFLYNDATNPKNKPEFWPLYWEKLGLLCELKVNNKPIPTDRAYR